MMITAVVLSLLLQSCSCFDYRGACSSPECDPSHEPVPNIFTAMTGYNILKGNPFAANTQTDPGFSGLEYIFIPTVKNGENRYGLDDGLTVRTLSNCDLSLQSNVYSTAKDYQKKLQQSSSSGADLATNLESDVSLSIPVKGAEVGVETTVPPLATAAFSANNEFQKNEDFFTKKSGIVSVAEAKCTIYTVKVSQTLPPKFHPGFIKMLFDLQEATEGSSRNKRRAFRRLIDNFGTHYLKYAEMGARIAMTRRLTREEAMKSTSEDIADCTKSSASVLYGLVKSSMSKCEKTSESSNTQLFDEYRREYTTSYGSRPKGSLLDWANQDFDNPLPIRMTLDPIVNLFREVFMEGLTDDDDKSLDYEGILKWLLPMYLNYCEDNKDSLHIASCDLNDIKKKGCGWNDDCEVDQECRNDKSQPEGYVCVNPTKTYDVKVKTTDKSWAGTDAKVWLRVADVNGKETRTINLDRPLKSDDPFEKGDINRFKFTTNKRLGNLKNIRIGHNNAGSSAGWHLSWVKVRDVTRDRTFKFICERWIADDEEDRRLDAECYEESYRNEWNSKKKKKEAKAKKNPQGQKLSKLIKASK